ncbi:hypothetical protein [Porphyromonas sp.]|uniref:hypothetical protein n=1 Tax=Porphyromonas sp. TaxID=1924944 RepID=UPI0026DCE443|nr:hypothetical protein [Porphyromonas sp.]MDO4770774.1 hypothetical protein [Porphyromonas sp.]
MNFELPYGPKGPKGRSAYEVWKKQVMDGEVTWPKDKVEISDYLIYIKGPKGDKGEDGLSAYEQWKLIISDGKAPNPHNPSEMWPPSRNTEADFWDYVTGRDGKTPRIGENGNWWIGKIDTGVNAHGVDGKDGKNGRSSYEVWKQNVIDGKIQWDKDRVEVEHYFQYLKGKDGKNGKDGLTPFIGKNGNWWIGTIDTGIKAQGPDGDNGNSGLTAYEVWYRDLKAGKIKISADGTPWPKDKDTIEDFWRYLRGLKGDQGVDGINGKSAYEIWKELVENGLENPKNPGNEWPKDKVSEVHFFEYLTGKDGSNGSNGTNGTNGVDGKSAYQLWAEELERRADTDNPLVDHKTNKPWDKNRNSIADFWEYLRGADGGDGTDGKPGEPGKPGATVIVIKGIPNVIAEYSQKEFGEYVSTVDGSVTYTVYDEKGNKAPAGSSVKGLPGLPDTDEYTFVTNDKGQFTIPREKLPLIREVEKRWGYVKEVTINNVTKQSASNTYVPNQVKTRIVLHTPTTPQGPDAHRLTGYHALFFRIERQLDPDGPWRDLPNYLPNVAQIPVSGYRVADHLDPIGTINMGRKLYNYNEKSASEKQDRRFERVFRVKIGRYMIENLIGAKSGFENFWDGQVNYATVAQDDTYYGVRAMWKGVCQMAPFQLGPYLKCITLHKFNPVTGIFLAVEGELDYRHFRLDEMYRQWMTTQTYTGKDNEEMVRVYSEKLTEAEARAKVYGYVSAHKDTPQGNQQSSSNGKLSGPTQTHYFINTVYLDGYLRSRTNHWTYQGEYSICYIRRKNGTDVASNQFEAVKTSSSQGHPDILVKYVP